MKRFRLFHVIWDSISGLLKREATPARLDDEPKKLIPLSEKRKGEIAWLMVKRRFATEGVLIGGALNKEALSAAQALGITVREVKLFFRTLYAELYNGMFPLNQIALGDKDRLPQSEMERLSLKYLQLHLGDGHSRLDKMRAGKEIANIAHDTRVSREELWSLFHDLLNTVFQQGFRISEKEATKSM
jgi:hypothetical protein